jgi:DNA-binding NarL/FixJ family response regulator
VARPRVILADDHVDVIKAFQQLLSNDCDVVATVSDGRSLVESALRLAPDIIITDISMPVLDGLEAVRQLKERCVPSKVIVLTMHSDPQLAVKALTIGADGYVLKLAASAELLKAIADVSCGLTYISPQIRDQLPREYVDRSVPAEDSCDKERH